MRSSCEMIRSACAQKSRRKRFDGRFVDREAGGGLVAAVGDEVLAAGGEAGVEIEAAGAAAGAHAGLGAELVERDEDRGAMVVLGEPAGDDADDAGVPAAAGEHQGGRRQRVADFVGQFVGGLVDAAFERLPLFVEAVDELGQLLGALGGFGGEQFEGERGLAQAAGGVEPRADREAEVFAVELLFLVEAGYFLERGDAERGVVAEAVEAVADEDAVFVDERHDVGDRADGGEADGSHQERSHRLADALGFAGLLAESPGELQRDGGAAQAGEGIGRAGQAGVDDRGDVGAVASRPSG